MFWKGIVTELLWFLKGDTNIKYLIDNGVNIWNEDAYNYYLKKGNSAMSFEEFIQNIKDGNGGGDCGYQYGKVWRRWYSIGEKGYKGIDQIINVIKSLRKNPESRRHIVTAIDPAHDKDLALYWCHAMFQFNCRPLNIEERIKKSEGILHRNELMFEYEETLEEQLDRALVPKYYLDCQLYQRSADAVLGVPFNIASYALLTHIIAKICNMIPGEFIHTFGDVHIYDNHKEAVEEQLKREPRKLPTLKMWWSDQTDDLIYTNLDNFFECLSLNYGFVSFDLEGYDPQPAIKAELSTGLKK